MIDIILIILLVISAYQGFRKGLINQLSDLLGLLLGLYGAVYFSHFAIRFLTRYLPVRPIYIKVIAFILVFIVIVWLVSIIGKFFEKTVKFIGLGFINRTGGVLFSLFKQLFILSILIMIIVFINSKINLFNPDYFDRSIVYKSAIHPIINFLRQSVFSFF